mmetsp:Transcript_64738/g.154625  ORF Transcript_64738/g.154625 Transcript_64738/m.154625 type:complete len:208 (-) Transcript_64738:99-722(-)
MHEVRDRFHLAGLAHWSEPTLLRCEEHLVATSSDNLTFDCNGQGRQVLTEDILLNNAGAMLQQETFQQRPVVRGILLGSTCSWGCVWSCQQSRDTSSREARLDDYGALALECLEVCNTFNVVRVRQLHYLLLLDSRRGKQLSHQLKEPPLVVQGLQEFQAAMREDPATCRRFDETVSLLAVEGLLGCRNYEASTKPSDSYLQLKCPS